MRARWIVVIAILAVGAIVAAVVGVAAFFSSPTGTEATPVDQSEAVDSGAPVEEDDDFGTVEVYTVNADGTLDPEASGLTAEIWDTFIRVATLETVSKVMTQYRVGNAPDSDTLAYVYQDDDPSQWILAANLATSENHNDLVATLVHEYAHILTLGQDEVTGDYSSCDTIVLDEGCADPDSAILAFEEQFWAPYGDAAPALDNADADVAYDFYLAHEDDFVSDYAATNAVEDIAECFMTWVVEDDPTGTSVVAQKFTFFEDYPALVAIRDRIRAEFAVDLGLSV